MEPAVEIPQSIALSEQIDKFADRVVRAGLSVPVLLFLEMHLPVVTLAHTGVLFIEPLLSPLFGAERLKNFRELLSERKNLELLIESIRRKGG